MVLIHYSGDIHATVYFGVLVKYSELGGFVPIGLNLNDANLKQVTYDDELKFVESIPNNAQKLEIHQAYYDFCGIEEFKNNEVMLGLHVYNTVREKDIALDIMYTPSNHRVTIERVYLKNLADKRRYFSILQTLQPFERRGIITNLQLPTEEDRWGYQRTTILGKRQIFDFCQRAFLLNIATNTGYMKYTLEEMRET